MREVDPGVEVVEADGDIQITELRDIERLADSRPEGTGGTTAQEGWKEIHTDLDSHAEGTRLTRVQEDANVRFGKNTAGIQETECGTVVLGIRLMFQGTALTVRCTLSLITPRLE